MTALLTALGLASRGRPVLALAPGSKIPPAGSRGVSEATTDPDEIRRMFDRVGEEGNIGLALGERSGMWVLDIDAKRPAQGGLTGYEGLELLQQDNGQLPPTQETETPSGGRHLWFQWPVTGRVIRPKVGLQVRNARASIDIRGEGSYVVIPPSRVDVAGRSRPYLWGPRRHVAFAPSWLLDIVCPAEVVIPPPPPAPYVAEDRAAHYAEAVLRSACDACASAAQGTRHHEWKKQALLIGGYVGGGHLSRQTAEADLVAAAMRAIGHREGHKVKDARSVIAWGISLGMTRPLHPPKD